VGRADRFPELARELVRLKVDVIVAWGTPAALAAKKATSTIPIVMANTGGPVGVGLVSSLAHPGGNVTGSATLLPELGAKRLDLLREVLPRVSRVAVLSNPANPVHIPMLNLLRSTAHSLRVRLVLVEAREAGGLASAVSSATNGGAGALMVLDGGHRPDGHRGGRAARRAAVRSDPE
jgi:putative ABC transport system substrate-binding protein